MKPKSKAGQRIAYLVHYVHHDHPNEWDRLVMPPIESVPASALIFLIHLLLLGNFGLPLFAGFLTGYLYYDFVHFSVHFPEQKVGWAAWQRRNHMQHHFKDEKRNFGVSSPLWDYIFRTI